jgi:hypothetical protein
MLMQQQYANYVRNSDQSVSASDNDPGYIWRTAAGEQNVVFAVQSTKWSTALIVEIIIDTKNHNVTCMSDCRRGLDW